MELAILKSAQVTKLAPGHAKQIWDVDTFLAACPAHAIKSWQAHVIQFHDDILPMGGIGTDPGLKLGLSFIGGEDVAYTFRTYVNRTGLSITDILGVFHSVPLIFNGMVTKATPVVVEGAAHNARYGQPLLGQIRGALLLGFANAGFDHVAEVPPLSIRKRVFGEGRIQPVEFWSTAGFIRADKDSADALSMAICAGL